MFQLTLAGSQIHNANYNKNSTVWSRAETIKNK